MQGLAEHAGDRLLRLKGIVRLAEAPERPLAIHAVGHVAHPPLWLDRPAGADAWSRVVVIGQDIPRYFPARLLAAIEAEVEEEATCRLLPRAHDGYAAPGATGGSRRGLLGGFRRERPWGLDNGRRSVI